LNTKIQGIKKQSATSFQKQPCPKPGNVLEMGLLRFFIGLIFKVLLVANGNSLN
jgi:hypothetical protein